MTWTTYFCKAGAKLPYRLAENHSPWRDVWYKYIHLMSALVVYLHLLSLHHRNYSAGAAKVSRLNRMRDVYFHDSL